MPSPVFPSSSFLLVLDTLPYFDVKLHPLLDRQDGYFYAIQYQFEFVLGFVVPL